MTEDSQIAYFSMINCLEVIEELKNEAEPMPFGKVQKYKSYISGRTPDDILIKETDPMWFGYAESMREFIELLDSKPKVEFVNKKAKK